MDLRSPSPRPLRRIGKRCRTAPVFTTLLALAACETNPFGSGRVRFEMLLIEVSGNHQLLPPGGFDSAPLVVRVVDQDGSPHRGMVIDWTLSEGTGALSAAASTSDADGLVQVTYTSGDEPGETVITASFNPVSSGSFASRPIDPVSFAITVEGA